MSSMVASGALGAMTTPGAEGGRLTTVTVEEVNGLPESVPSKGVTVTVSVSPD